MKNKQGILLGISALLFILSVAIYLQGPSKTKLQEQYRVGYSAGRKAEQARWADVYLQVAKQAIKDQIESQPSIERLLKGDFKSLQIGSVEKKGNDKALVWLEGRWKDKTYSVGYFEFKKINDYWFIMTTRKTADEKLAVPGR